MRGSLKLMAVGFCPQLGGLFLGGDHVMSSTHCIPYGWKWTLSSGKDFTVKSLSHMVDSILLEPYHSEQKFKWNSWVPRKINILAWRAFNDRLPLLVNLDNRGLDVGSVLCPFCSNAPEDANHLLTCCPLVVTIWRKVFSWWKIGFPSNLSLSLLASWVSHFPHNKDSGPFLSFLLPWARTSKNARV
ncbi:RNA-directed DNA polymerase, eukaryota, reverse transcriptase zinc-binding domain protein [Tanacetum coccineum]